MLFRCSLGHIEQGADVGIALALSDPGEHFGFPRRETEGSNKRFVIVEIDGERACVLNDLIDGNSPNQA